MKLHLRQYKKYYVRIAIALLMFIGVLVISGVEAGFSGQLKEQSLAQRWSSQEEFVQLSCFFKQGEGIEAGQIPMLEYMLMQAMTDAAIDTEEFGGRSLVAAYSTETTLDISSNRANTTVRAYGVSKDYFLFHPLELLSGTYFSNDDINQDGVILDELVAWQLFGSYEVAGLTVEINGNLYPVRGVVRGNQGAYVKAAGDDAARIYVDYAMLDNGELGSPLASSYELLIRNPVKDYGRSTLQTTLKDSMGLAEEQYELVDNTHRFRFAENWKRIAQFGKRSMHSVAIAYPTWENRARAYEDVMSLLEVVRAILVIYPVVILVMAIVFGIKQLGRAFARMKLSIEQKRIAARKKKKRALEKESPPHI